MNTVSRTPVATSRHPLSSLFWFTPYLHRREKARAERGCQGGPQGGGSGCQYIFVGLAACVHMGSRVFVRVG